MRGSLRAGVGAALVGLAAAAWPGGATAAGGCPVSVATAEETQLSSMIAAQRRAERVPKVRGHKKLLRAGRAKSIAMAAGAKFAHSAAMPWAAKRGGGQNLAMATTAAQAFAGMLASPSHKRNMLAAEWRYAGVGAARGCDGMVYFTINFMGPPAG